MHRVGELYEVVIDLTPKPIKGDWNGSGCHTNFSTESTRNDTEMTACLKYLDNLSKNHFKNIEVYGPKN